MSFQNNIKANNYLLPFAFLLSFSCGNGASNSSDSDGTLDFDSGSLIDSINERDMAIEESPIVGDWFKCLDDKCQSLHFWGKRFYSDGTYTSLFASTRTQQRAENYCVYTDPKFTGQYKWKDHVLELEDVMNEERTTETADYVIADEIAKVAYNGESWLEKKIIPANDQGPCSDRNPWVCVRERPSFNLTGNECSFSWNCDNGFFYMECSRDNPTEDFTCKCSQGKEQPFKTFTASDKNLCQLQIGGGIYREVANINCNWEVWVIDEFLL